MNSDTSVEECEYPEIKPKREKINKNQCIACGKHISDRRNLVRHLRKIHCIEPIVRKPQLKCSFNDDCTFLCATSEKLREHLKKAHNFHVIKKVLNFKSRPDFEKWREDEEDRTNARYVAYTGTKSRGTRKVYYLKCHRSGTVRCESNTSQRKRSKPSKGYTQCGATCPSSITVAETASGIIQVMYYPIHLGHSLDDESIPYMKLSIKEKEEIVGKLAQGEPVSKIVSDARKLKGNKLSRINLLQRRDVYNIKKNVNYLEKESDHVGKEIDTWVKTLNMDGLLCNPIALYNPSEETQDYCLILIHYVQKIIFSLAFEGSIVYVKTKKGKPNVDFNLVAVSVICENGDGYPIAFCISHKTEYITLYTFFKIIYQNFGLIKAQVFVSDNTGHYYIAWKKVMGECENKLVCTFDIESYWEQKLTSLKCPINKQKTATAQLKCLLEQLDKDAFECELAKMLKNWEEDEDMKLFANYFQKYYVKKQFEWATCYRIHSTRNESINRYLEPVNNVLEFIYEESYNSVQTALNLLLSFVRDVCLLNLLQWDVQAAKEKHQETEKNHEISLGLDRVKQNSGSEWIVSDGESDFVVKKLKSGCDKKCGVFCEKCNVCAHDYNCVCSDYVTGFNICRHLHAVGIVAGETKPDELTDNSATIALKHSAVAMARTLTAHLESSNLTQEEYKRIITVLSSIREDVTGDNPFVKIWKPDLAPVSEMEAPGGILSMAVCDHVLYTCSTDECIHSWDLKAMKNSGKISTTLFQPQKLFVDPATKLLWAGDSQGNVAKFENGKECGKFELVEEIWDLMITSNPNLVYTARDRDVVVSEIITGADRTRVMVKTTLQGRSPFCIVGNHFCYLNREGRNVNVHQNNVDEKFPKLREMAASDLIINAMAGAGEGILYTGGYDSIVRKWDLKSGNSLGEVNLGCCINSLACRSENEVYAARSDGFIAKIVSA